MRVCYPALTLKELFLGPKAAMPCLKSSEGSQEIHAAKVWPECFFKIKLGLSALPEQET
jgi:hypothetical protein